jgi:cytochrome c553
MTMTRLLAFLVMMLGLAMPALAEERSVYWPQIPAATGQPHPEGNEYMRKQHMEMMKHDRDATMYDGDREVKASLSECFECHTVKDDQGTPVTYSDEKHFCRTCHDFAAVKVDCFMCHRSTPDGFEEPDAHALATQEPASQSRLRAYLDSLKPQTSELAQNMEVTE